MGFAFLVSLLIVGSAIAVGLHLYRRKQVEAVAEELGFRFIDNPTVLDEIRTFPLAQEGHSKRCYHCMEGEADGIKIRVFEYGYAVGRGKTQVPISHTIAYLTFDSHRLPSFSLRNRSFLSRFEHNEYGAREMPISYELDTKFKLTSSESAATSVFDQAVVDELLRQGRCVEAEGNGIVIYQHNHTVNHKMLEAFVKDSLKMMMLIRNSIENPNPIAQEPEIVTMPDGSLRLARV